MSASNAPEGAGTRYNPRLVSAPGQPVEVTVDLPDDATDQDIFAAMAGAAELALPSLTATFDDRPAPDLPPSLLPAREHNA
ncbi:hypothetical protein [Nocardioides pakistanensis]